MQVPGWEDAEIRSVCLQITQSYPQISGDFDEAIDTIAERLLQALNITTVADAGTCDATLSLIVSGTALGDSYDDGFLYTGGEYSGTVSLQAVGRPEATQAVEERIDPPGIVFFPGGSPPTTPEQAPFDEVSSKVVVSGFAHFWGFEVYLGALQASNDSTFLLLPAVDALEEALQSGTLSASEADSIVAELEMVPILRNSSDGVAVARLLQVLMQSNLLSPDAKALSVGHLSFLLQNFDDTGARGAAVEVLGELGAAGQIGDDQLGPIVLALIDLLDHEYELLGQDAATALERITGNSFGMDAERWSEWWASRQ